MMVLMLNLKMNKMKKISLITLVLLLSFSSVLGQKKNMLLKKYKSKEYYDFLKNLKNYLDPKKNLGANKLFKS